MADTLETTTDLEALFGADGVGEDLEFVGPDSTVYAVVGVFDDEPTGDQARRNVMSVSSRVIEVEIPSHMIPAGLYVGTDLVDTGKHWRLRRDGVDYYIADVGARLHDTTKIQLSTNPVDRA